MSNNVELYKNNNICSVGSFIVTHCVTDGTLKLDCAGVIFVDPGVLIGET